MISLAVLATGIKLNAILCANVPCVVFALWQSMVSLLLLAIAKT